MARLPAGMFKRKQDGLYVLRFTVDGKKYTVYGATKERCQENEMLKREQIEKEKAEKAAIPTVQEYFDTWIEGKRNSKRKPVKSATLRSYRKLIKRITGQKIGKEQKKFGDMILTEIKKKTIEQLQESLLNDGLTTRTTNDSISILKQALNAAYYDDILEKNPADGVKSVIRTEAPARETIHRALTREETEKFLQAAADSWYYPLYVFLLNTGLRIGEASALAIRDVTELQINVYKTVTRTEAGYTIAEQTKTEAGRRKIDTRPEAWRAWNDQRMYNEAINSGKVVKLDNPVFTLPKGGIIRPDRVNEDIKRICKLTDIEYFTCHAFRATFTSRCIAAGVPAKILMEILGHTDVQMTLGLYGHAEDQQKREKLLAVNL